AAQAEVAEPELLPDDARRRPAFLGDPAPRPLVVVRLWRRRVLHPDPQHRLRPGARLPAPPPPFPPPPRPPPGTRPPARRPQNAGIGAPTGRPAPCGVP